MAATVMAASTLTACSSSDQYVHCVDKDGRVVDPHKCDNDGGGAYWYYMSTHRYPVGGSVPSDWHTSRVNPGDEGARTKAGLPPKGNVGGKAITGGGFGRGGTGGEGGHGSVGGHGGGGHGGGG